MRAMGRRRMPAPRLPVLQHSLVLDDRVGIGLAQGGEDLLAVDVLQEQRHLGLSGHARREPILHKIEVVGAESVQVIVPDQDCLDQPAQRSRGRRIQQGVGRRRQGDPLLRGQKGLDRSYRTGEYNAEERLSEEFARIRDE